MNYFNYYLPNESIEKAIEVKKTKKLVFHVDMSSIGRGLYSRNVLEYEFEQMRSKQPLSLMYISLKTLLEGIYKRYSKYEPAFCIFYDLGGSVQNKIVSAKYKANRTTSSKAFLKTEEEAELYYKMRLEYYRNIPNHFNINKVSKVVCLNEYESDFVPFYFIKKYEYLQDPDILNIIMSIDKDLLQCCQLPNTFQAISRYSRKDRSFTNILYGNRSALSYIYKNFSLQQYPQLTSKYIPLVLALASDKADGIDGVKRGFGIVSAIKVIAKYKLPHDFDINYPLPIELGGCQDQIQMNLDMTSFERQIQRVPKYILDVI